MDALLEHPETFGYLAQAIETISESGKLADRSSAAEHLANVVKRKARYKSEMGQ
jgi:hypothetical protein